MPIILKKEDQGSILAVWKVTESLEQLTSNEVALRYLDEIKKFSSPSRKVEWLTVRILLYELLNEHKVIIYSKSGKPYLQDRSYEIGISHTCGFVAVHLAQKPTTSIDIEYRNNRISRVAQRVFSPAELGYGESKNSQTYELVMWCAKETLFKAFDLNNIDFRKDLLIHPFRIDSKQGIITGQEFKTEEQRSLDIFYHIEEDFILTYA